MPASDRGELHTTTNTRKPPTQKPKQPTRNNTTKQPGSYTPPITVPQPSNPSLASGHHIHARRKCETINYFETRRRTYNIYIKNIINITTHTYT